MRDEQAWKIRSKKIISIVLSFALLLMFPSKSAAGVTPTTITLISPLQGEDINPNFPFTITIDLIGGSAANAKSCFAGWNNETAFGDFSFGAQMIDVNNFGKTLTWGGNGSIYRTGDQELLGWTTKIIPGGIECSLKINQNNRFDLYGADFGMAYDELANPVDTRNIEWFGTKSASELKSNSLFSTVAFLDIAWKSNGVLTKKRFNATTKGSPTVKIIGLERGQLVDYETKFEVVANLSSKYKVKSLYVAADGRGDRDWATCEPIENAAKIDNGDGTITYKSKCFINLVETDLSEQSIEIEPVLYTDISEEQAPRGESVVINIGKQGVPACQSTIDSSQSRYSNLSSTYQKLKSEFQLITTARAGRVMVGNLNVISAELKKINSDVLSLNLVTELCKNNLTELNASTNWLGPEVVKLSKSVQDFVNSPAAQAKAVANAKARAAQARAAQAAQAKNLYNLGFNFVSKLSSVQLVNYSFLNFIQPGKKSLSVSYARDWCGKLPRIVPGLVNSVGLPANTNFVNGCSKAALKITIK